MKLRATMLAFPLAAGLALAQSTSGAGAQTTGSQTSGSSGQQQSGSQSGSQADRTGQTGQSGSAAGAQSGSTAGTQADRTGAGGSGEPAQMKTMKYKGTLVDLSCGSTSGAADRTSTATTGASTATAGQSGSAASGQSTTPGASTAGGSMASSAAGAAGTANRVAGGECTPTANSTNLGLKMDNGQTVRFDLVGNQRAQDGLKNNKSWSKNLSANKPLKVKVSGVLQGDKLIVSSIN